MRTPDTRTTGSVAGYICAEVERRTRGCAKEALVGDCVGDLQAAFRNKDIHARIPLCLGDHTLNMKVNVDYNMITTFETCEKYLLG